MGVGMNRTFFEIKKNSCEHYYFVLRQDDDRCKVISSSYQSRLELERSISMIRETAHLSDCICDMNVRPSQPYFQILSEAECFYFQLIGLKREIIFTSIGYNSIQTCKDCIDVVKNMSMDAGVQDYTL